MTKKQKSLSSKDPKYLGIPNINFSLTDEYDSREKNFVKQRLKRGFDDSETWSLDCTMAAFILPRLKRYLKVADEVIVIEKERKKDIKKVIKAMKLIIRDNGSQIWTIKEEEDVIEGLQIFGKIFLHLGW